MENQSDISCLEYDDDAAIAFITKKLPEDLRSVIDEDDVQYLLDVMYDYYDVNHLLDEETDEAVEIVEEDMLQYILQTAKKDKMDMTKFTADNVQTLLDLEYEYSKSLGVY